MSSWALPLYGNKADEKTRLVKPQTALQLLQKGTCENVQAEGLCFQFQSQLSGTVRGNSPKQGEGLSECNTNLSEEFQPEFKVML